MEMLVRCLILLLAHSALLHSSKDPCQAYGNFLTCNSPGLRSLPTIAKEISVFVVSSQTFANPVLGRRNLTDYPKMFRKMSIINTTLSRIESNTFSDIDEINELNLKGNFEYVDAEAFAHVNITSLNLDGNQGIRFHQNAFKNSIIKKLSLKQCDLVHIPYATFEWLFINQHLTSLSLENNKLTELDQAFNLPIQTLKTFLLNGNPIDCKCSMKWLIQLAPNLNNGGKDLKCASPRTLANVPLVAVTSGQIDCMRPEIANIDMSFNFEDSEKLSVDIHCKARGTNELRVQLLHESSPSNSQVYDEYRDNAFMTLVAPKPTPRLTHGGDPIIDAFGQIQMNPLEPEHLKCIVQDVNGNVTTNLVIKWPRMLVKRANLSIYQPEHQLSLRSEQENIENEFFLKKKFTILEMIGAVIGTFLSTIALFLFLYCIRYDSIHGCYFSCCLKSKQHHHKMFKNNHATNINHSQSHMTKDSNLGLLQYQNGHLNQTAFTAINPVLIPTGGYQSAGSDDANHTHSSSSGYDQNSNATLSKRVSYVTYDALSGSNNQNNNPNPSNNINGPMHPQYTDCQTYDLPQNQIQAPTPLLPLPPLPRENPPPIPTTTTMYNAQQQSILDQNLQAAFAVATLTRMQNNHQQQLGMNGAPNLNNIDVNLLQQQWNYLTMLQNQNALLTPTQGSKN